MLEEWGKRQESGLARWGRLDALVQKLDANPKREKRLAPVLVEIIFTYTYPRLDGEHAPPLTIASHHRL